MCVLYIHSTTHRNSVTIVPQRIQRFIEIHRHSRRQHYLAGYMGII